MLSQLRPAIVMIALFTLLTGVAYPLAVTGVAQVAAPFQAGGSLVRRDGKVVGSALIGQGFAEPRYLHSRGSAAGNGYDATSSGGSNLGPMDPKLAKAVGAAAEQVRKDNPGVGAIPADAVTDSGSGLDPDVSPANAALQAPRIAQVRDLPLSQVSEVIARDTRSRALGFIGQPAVNVLAVNRDLDSLGSPR